MNQPELQRINHSSGIVGAVASRIGGRSENQDSFIVADTPLGLLVAVCDGMGGGPAGKEASTIAAETIAATVMQATPDMDPAEVLRVAAINANDAVIEATVANPALRGMGTTCVAVLFKAGRGYVVHVGDSRCYQVRDGKMVFRTADHSYVAEMVRHGTLTEEEARNSNYSNVITRAIGAATTVDPEVDIVPIAPHDRFALMTDGIWGAIPEQALIDAFTAEGDLAVTVEGIASGIDSIGHEKGGGHDNLTLAIIELPGVVMATPDAPEPAIPLEADPRPGGDDDSAASSSALAQASAAPSQAPAAAKNREPQVVPTPSEPMTLAEKVAAEVAEKRRAARKEGAPATADPSAERKKRKGCTKNEAAPTAAPPAEIDNYSLESDDTPPGEERKAERRGVKWRALFWVVAVALLGLISWNIWMMIRDDQAAEEAAKEADNKKISLLDAQTVVDAVDEVKEGKTDAKLQDAKTAEKPKNEKLKEAVEDLNELKKPYSNKFTKKNNEKEFESREAERKAKIESVVGKLEDYGKTLGENDKRKDKIDKIIETAKQSRIEILDTSHSDVTGDAMKNIEKLITMINELEASED
ncbi:MAG: protein phosphatase 2C domain-containing protein [Muribaculaceae bacterium]|nr:protein phosphatase 2C domain-containing protein [Muribaculaceae bacterium]